MAFENEQSKRKYFKPEGNRIEARSTNGKGQKKMENCSSGRKTSTPMKGRIRIKENLTIEGKCAQSLRKNMAIEQQEYQQ